MWGKVSFHRNRKPVGGDTSPTRNQVYKSPSPLAAHDRDLSTKALPNLPSAPDSHFTAQPPDPNHRVASSIYSRDSVVFDHIRQRSISDNYRLSSQLHPSVADHGYTQGTRSVDISPPDSPITRIHSRSSSRVSPVEDEPVRATAANESKLAESKFMSHIPILKRRADSQPQPTKPSARVTRWDDFSGEPTTSNQGRLGQVTPSNVSFETHVSAAPLPSQSSKIFGWGKEQLSSRKKALEGRNRSYGGDGVTSPAPREPWKGPSGREPIIHPIQEKSANMSTSVLPLSTSNEERRELHNPSPVSAIVPSSTIITTASASEETPKRAPRMRTNNTREARKHTSAVGGDAPPRIDLVSGRELSGGLTGLRLADVGVNEPTSRFSVTTYDPTEAGSSTSSPRNSMTPSPPPSIVDQTPQSSDLTRTIMYQAQPVPSTIAPGKRPTRKPTPSEVTPSKALPPNPAEATAQGRIEMLEAKRSDLVRRRNNINTIIHELTQVIQPSSVAYDMAARDEVKKTVASLNNELAEIKREEHDIGLKLLRAWKKREDEDYYGHSTSLWVKRVTS
ncbi:uncharacterized protein BJX67DRAFT_371389 [Aspergillus lucknowensis]|uniref:BHLH domain-containing protein n=1 Tax=Aspergillus lucknowensis TaxID=176173 RepID=A0ABR4LUS3_9EURO